MNATNRRAAAVTMSVLTVLVGLFGCRQLCNDATETEASTHMKAGATPLPRTPNFNDPVVTGGYCLDMEPQPLGYIDASFDGGVLDGGWYADSGGGRIPKGILLSCSGTTANVAVDMLGYGGSPGQINYVFTGVACGVFIPALVTKVYQVGTTATTVQLCY